MIYASTLTRLYPALNASSGADLVFWTDADLAGWLQEAAQRLSRFALFAEVDVEPVAIGGAGYSLPANYRAIVEAEFNGRVLRRVSVAQLEARSESWDTDSGTVEQCLIDASTIRIWRLPTVSGALTSIYFAWPTVTAATSDRFPHAVLDALTWDVLAQARSSVGEAMAPDIAAQARERVRLYDSVIESYWGAW